MIFSQIFKKLCSLGLENKAEVHWNTFHMNDSSLTTSDVFEKLQCRMGLVLFCADQMAVPSLQELDGDILSHSIRGHYMKG